MSEGTALKKILKTGPWSHQEKSDPEKDDDDKSEQELETIDESLRKKIWILLAMCHVMAFQYGSAHSITYAAFPYYTKELRISTEQYGYLLSAYAFGQLISAPFYGRFSDVVGVRMALGVAFVCCCIEFTILVLAQNLTFVFISRIPSMGIHGMQVIYMILSDITLPSQRADMMGKLSLSHGLGSIFGTYVGGVIAEHLGTRSAFLAAGGQSAACIVATAIFIPRETSSIRLTLLKFMRHEREVSKEDESTEQAEKPCNAGTVKRALQEVLRVAQCRHVIYLMFIKAVGAIPIVVFHSMVALLMMEYFHLKPVANGRVHAFLGLVGMVVQGVLVGVLTKQFNDAVVINISFASLAIGFLFLIVTRDIYIFCVVACLLVFGGSVVHIVITAIGTKIVPAQDTGVVIALLNSIPRGVVAVFAPTIGSFMYTRLGFPSFGVLGYVVNSMLTVYLLIYGRPQFDDVT